jgi:hypothetical protein
MIRGAAGIGIVRVDLQQRAVVQQAVEDVRRLVAGRRHDLDAIGAVLIGEMGIEAEAGIAPVPAGACEGEPSARGLRSQKRGRPCGNGLHPLQARWPRPILTGPVC